MSIAVSEVGEERQIQEISTYQISGIKQTSAGIGSPSVFPPGHNI